MSHICIFVQKSAKIFIFRTLTALIFSKCDNQNKIFVYSQGHRQGKNSFLYIYRTKIRSQNLHFTKFSGAPPFPLMCTHLTTEKCSFTFSTAPLFENPGYAPDSNQTLYNRLSTHDLSKKLKQMKAFLQKK